MFEQAHEGVCQDFVRTVTDEYLSWRDVEFGEVRSHGFLEAVGVGVGIKAQGGAVDPKLALHGGDRVW